MQYFNVIRQNVRIRSLASLEINKSNWQEINIYIYIYIINNNNLLLPQANHLLIPTDKSNYSLSDGPLDTSPECASRSTYVPSLLHFHEEIMLIQGIKPSFPKRKPSLRDIIIKELEESRPILPPEDEQESGIFTRIYLGMQGSLSKIPFFKS